MAVSNDRAYPRIDRATGKPFAIMKDTEAAFGFLVVDRDGTKRDLTNDTLAVSARDTDAGTAKTWTFTADANQTTTGKGKCTLVCPATDTDAAGAYAFDLKVNGRVLFTGRIDVAVSDAVGS